MNKSPAAEAIIQQTFAAMAVKGAIARESRTGIAADPIIRFLKAYIARTKTPITGHGMAGAAQVFISLASVEWPQIIRAEKLIVVRIGQLTRNHDGVRRGFTEAKRWRLEYVRRRAVPAISRKAA